MWEGGHSRLRADRVYLNNEKQYEVFHYGISSRVDALTVRSWRDTLKRSNGIGMIYKKFSLITMYDLSFSSFFYLIFSHWQTRNQKPLKNFFTHPTEAYTLVDLRPPPIEKLEMT